MKKASLILCFLFAMTFLASCGESGNPGKTDSATMTDYTSILQDKKFEQGFVMRGLGDPIYGDDIEYFGDMFDPGTVFDYGSKGKHPVWRACQWATRYPFHDVNNTTDPFNYRFTDKGNGRYLYENRSKTIETDTRTGEIRLALDGGECYKYPRTQGQSWPHLLFEQYFSNGSAPDPNARVSELDSVRVKLDVKMNEFVDYMGDSADPSLHSAMFLVYLFVYEYDPDLRAFTDMLWFGLPVFDNRHVFSAEASFPDVGTKESATNKWIFNIASHLFFNNDNNLYSPDGEILYDEYKSVDIELLGLIRRAFDDAQRAGYMKGSKWENLYINGTYFGFELPGTYKLDMTVKNLDILTLRRQA